MKRKYFFSLFILLIAFSCARKKAVTTNNTSFDVVGKYRVVDAQSNSGNMPDAEFQEAIGEGFIIELTNIGVKSKKILDFLLLHKIQNPRIGHMQHPEEGKVIFYWQQKENFILGVSKKEVDDFLINGTQKEFKSNGFFLEKENNKYTFHIVTNGKKEGFALVAVKEK